MKKCSAERMLRVIEQKGLILTEYKRRMVMACDGCPVITTPSGRHVVDGKDGRRYYPEAVLGSSDWRR